MANEFCRIVFQNFGSVATSNEAWQVWRQRSFFKGWFLFNQSFWPEQAWFQICPWSRNHLSHSLLNLIPIKLELAESFMMVKRVFLIYLRPNIAFLPINFGTTDVFQVLVAEKEIFEAPNFFSLPPPQTHSSLLSCFKLLNLGEWSLEFCWLKGFFQRLHQKRLPLCWASKKK